MSANFTPEKEDYKILTPFKMQVLTNFPYIEADFDALTNYQLLCKIVEYLNGVIHNENELTEQVNSLYNAYVSLQNYVNNYFDNLNVQDEINKKLDEMAQDGSLTNLIKEYVDPIFINYTNEVNGIIDGQNTNINNFENSVDHQIEVINSTVSSIASGSPAGVYSTVSDLQTADPDHSRIYVVVADGNWYYYNTSNSTWTAGGTYQSAGIGNNDIKYNMLEEALQKDCLYSYGITGSYPDGNVGKKWSGSIGGTITLETTTNYKAGILEVNPGDVLVIPFMIRAIYSGAVLFFCNNNTIVDSISYSTLIDSDNLLDLPKYYKVPAGVNNVKFNTYGDLTNSPNLSWYPYIIKGYSYLDSRYTNSLIERVEVSPTSVSNVVNSLSQDDYSQSNYRSYYFDVKPLDKIHVETIVEQAAQFVAGIFYDSDNKRCGYLKPQYKSGDAIVVSVDTIVPANAVKFVTSVHESHTSYVHLYKYYPSEIIPLPNKKLSATYEDGALTIENKINGNILKFDHFGGNSLFMIKQFKVGNVTKTIGTDMIPAPYTMFAINNANGDRPEALLYGAVGGNHQWNNQGTGSTPTAREISLSIYTDNETMSDGDTKTCDNITIVETNRIQANNTCLEAGGGREVLEEKIIFNFDGTILKVKNTFTPLEEIRILKYYGIQTAGALTSEYTVYGDKVYAYNETSQVTKKPDIIYASNIVASKLYNSGIGDYRYNHSNLKVEISNNKSYYVPIFENYDTFSAGDINYLEGEYVFKIQQI